MLFPPSTNTRKERELGLENRFGLRCNDPRARGPNTSMPNLNFYAVGEDFVPVLDYIFAKRRCRVFENASAFDSELVEFRSPGEVLARYADGSRQSAEPSLYMQLVPPGANLNFRIRRINLHPDTGATFRHEIVGWGLIQFYLGGLGAKGVVLSHTNHNSLVRSRSWEAICEGMGPVHAWDWNEVMRISDGLYRFIRRRAVGRFGSRPILPEAAKATANGAPLLPN